MWHPNHKFASLSDSFAMRDDRPAVQFHEILDQRQANAQPASRSRRARRSLHKHLEYFGQCLWINADPRVANANHELPIFSGRVQVNLTARLGVFSRIAE